jgi:predicted TIM-barrel fold metal-dependent hydrolase
MKIWANSGDSHLVEPDDLFTSSLPPSLASRMPRSVKDADGIHETLYIDGQEIRRRMPRAMNLKDDNGLTVDQRAPGANDMKLRLVDLDHEGIWAELVFPSIGIWMSSIQDPALLAAGCEAINDWAFEYQRFSSRYVCTATIPLLDTEYAVAEIHRAAGIGFKAAYFSVTPGLGAPDWNYEMWEPVWAAIAGIKLVTGPEFRAGVDAFIKGRSA